MPWTGSSFASKHNHSLSKTGGAKASSIANAILKSGGDEGVAIATANKYANKHAGKLKKRGVISPKAADRRLSHA
jgi:uncharacterized protein YdaT